MFCLQRENFLHFHQAEQTENGGNELCDNGSQSNAVDAHAEFGHKKQIQYDIDDRRYEQVGEGGHGIAESS